MFRINVLLSGTTQKYFHVWCNLSGLLVCFLGQEFGTGVVVVVNV